MIFQVSDRTAAAMYALRQSIKRDDEGNHGCPPRELVVILDDLHVEVINAMYDHDLCIDCGGRGHITSEDNQCID